MLTKQIVLIFSAVAFLACGLCPPWVCVYKVEGAYLEKDGGYGLIFAPPSPDSHVDKLPGWQGTGSTWSTKIDMSRLVVEWVCVCALTGLAWFFVAKSNRVDGT
jgi:hypothetical protein